MADILSLSKTRKAKAHDQKVKAAAGNRLKFGRTKAQKQHDAATKALEATKIDAHKREE